MAHRVLRDAVSAVSGDAASQPLFRQRRTFLVGADQRPSTARHARSKAKADAQAEPAGRTREASSSRGRGCVPSAPAHFQRPGASKSSAPDFDQFGCSAGGAENSSEPAQHRADSGAAGSGAATPGNQQGSARKAASKAATRGHGDGWASAGRSGF